MSTSGQGGFAKLDESRVRPSVTKIPNRSDVRTVAEIIYQHALRLPEAAGREALDFIEFLEKRYPYGSESASTMTASADKPRRRAGSAKGVFLIQEDDDAHLADFGEYMP
jgi:hypothetical protein